MCEIASHLVFETQAPGALPPSFESVRTKHVKSKLKSFTLYNFEKRPGTVRIKKAQIKLELKKN